MGRQAISHQAFKPLDLLFLERLVVAWSVTQRALCTAEESISPPLDIGHGEAVLAGGLLHGGLSAKDAHYEGTAPLGSPALDWLVVG